MSEPCRLRRGEGYDVRDDEASRSRCSRCSRHGRHVLIEAQLTKPTALRRGLFLAEARAYPKGDLPPAAGRGI